MAHTSIVDDRVPACSSGSVASDNPTVGRNALSPSAPIIRLAWVPHNNLMPNRDAATEILRTATAAPRNPESAASTDKTGTVGRMTTRPEGARVAAVVGAAIVDDLLHPTVLLAARRTEPPALAGGWEFPGGKVDPGETQEEALHREVREELGVEVELGAQVPGPLQDGRWPLGEAFAMTVWLARVTAGVAAPIEDHDQLRWLRRQELHDVPWLPADLPIVDAIAPHLYRV